jgi:hypothetical protein
MQRFWAIAVVGALTFATPGFAQNAPGGSGVNQDATGQGSAPDGSGSNGLDAYGQANPDQNTPPPPNYTGLLIGGLAVGGIVTGIVIATQNNNNTTTTTTAVSP